MCLSPGDYGPIYSLCIEYSNDHMYHNCLLLNKDKTEGNERQKITAHLNLLSLKGLAKSEICITCISVYLLSSKKYRYSKGPNMIADDLCIHLQQARLL